jgi:hypothetical protein
MEIPKRLWIGIVVLVAIFGGYAILNRLCQPEGQAA